MLGSGYNLPPGCYDHHIPGNRPQDILRERIEEEISAEWEGNDFEACDGCEQLNECRMIWFYDGGCDRFDEAVDERMNER